MLRRSTHGQHMYVNLLLANAVFAPVLNGNLACLTQSTNMSPLNLTQTDIDPRDDSETTQFRSLLTWLEAANTRDTAWHRAVKAFLKTTVALNICFDCFSMLLVAIKASAGDLLGAFENPMKFPPSGFFCRH